MGLLGTTGVASGDVKRIVERNLGVGKALFLVIRVTWGVGLALGGDRVETVGSAILRPETSHRYSYIVAG